MTRVRVHCFSTSLDGRAAGPHQSLDAPMGVGGELLHGWVFETAYGRAMIGQDGGTTGVDDAWLRRGDVGVGATVMGRNMFGPVRGPWPVGDDWRGWCDAYWTDFNGGGWVWHGHAGRVVFVRSRPPRPVRRLILVSMTAPVAARRPALIGAVLIP